MTITEATPTAPKMSAVRSAAGRQNAPGIRAVDLCQINGDQKMLHNIDLTITPGTVVGIAGGSGAGKTTLLETLAGIRKPSSGEVIVTPEDRVREVGFVPQDDIIHVELPLRRTLSHAAGLRMPRGTSRLDREAAVDRVLHQLDLVDRADVKVANLSGGQRKRASIAVELLNDPDLLFLDEPTSGLDPATAATVMEQIRELAARGATVVLTTHAPTDLVRCDEVVFLADGGFLACVGTPDEAVALFDVDSIGAIYEHLATWPTLSWAKEQPAERRDRRREAKASRNLSSPSAARENVYKASRLQTAGAVRQWQVLTSRTVDLLLRNGLTLAILVGSPVGVIGMLALLFPSGLFDFDQTSPGSAIQMLFWIAFSSLFFGVTYGLLQIVGEIPILRRERKAGLSLAAYIGSKVAVLAPILLAINVSMILVMERLDRLVVANGTEWFELCMGATLTSLTGLAMGLVASAAVQNPAQATLALPMICFPQVLFAGGAIAVSDMAIVGRVMSFGMANRWGFEAMGRTIKLDGDLEGNAALSGFHETFSGPAVTGLVTLALLAGAFTLTAVGVLHKRLDG